MVDKDGSYQYSKVLSVTVAGQKDYVKVLGNPISNRQVKLELRMASGRYTIEVVSMEGHLLTTTSMVADGNVMMKSMSLAGIPTGIYTLRLRSAKNSYSERILIQ